MREYSKWIRDVELDSSAKLHGEERQGKRTTQEETSVPERSENQTSEIRTTEIRTTEIRTSDKDVRTLDPVLNYNGYFPLKCMVFSPELFLRLSAGQYKLFSYLSFLAWRYPIKHPAGPSCVRAALPYLARGTNLGRSAIVDYLEGLAGFGMIRCVETNKKTGNVYLSELWLLDRVKLTDETLEMAGQYALDSLQWMKKERLINDLEVSAEFKAGELVLKIDLSLKDQTIYSFAVLASQGRATRWNG
jgi:hypothetical protein